MPLRRFSVAPMMDWTDRHERFFLRLLSRRALLYTEMVTAAAVVRGDRDRLIGFSAEEQPVAVQLGGSDPSLLAEAARIAEGYGYVEIDLNVGCPSDRVQSGRFGACLMAEPALVARCVGAMKKAVSLPVTVKCRLGIDDQRAEETLPRFLEAIRDAGTDAVTIHARKAWLDGLSPKENRNVPPLDYELVYEMKRRYPDLEILINGGITSLDDAEAHLEQVDGIMVGRAAYQTPFLLATVDSRLFGAEDPVANRRDVIDAFCPYVEAELAQGTPLHAMTRHIMGLYQGVRGARAWRRHLSEFGPRPNAGLEVLLQAASAVDPTFMAA